MDLPPNIRATKWSKFEKRANVELSKNLPDDRNLTPDEVSESIREVTLALTTALRNTALVSKKVNGILKYLNSKIKTLQKDKAKVIKLLHETQRAVRPDKLDLLHRLKWLLNKIKAELRAELSNSIAGYWRAQLGQVNHRDPTAFFPKINRLLRSKKLIEIADQRINRGDPACATGAIDMNKACPIGEELLINDPIDKLNVIGEFYQYINAPRYLNTGSRLKECVDKEATDIKSVLASKKLMGSTVTTFSENNRASCPKMENEAAHPFTNHEQLTRVLKKLPNKTSSGPDGIPSIMLKHLPKRITTALVIIFNNAINHSFFPDS